MIMRKIDRAHIHFNDLSSAPPRRMSSLVAGVGLTAWNRRSAEAETWIQETLARQDVYGKYNTEQLALLCLA